MSLTARQFDCLSALHRLAAGGVGATTALEMARIETADDRAQAAGLDAPLFAANSEPASQPASQPSPRLRTICRGRTIGPTGLRW